MGILALILGLAGGLHDEALRTDPPARPLVEVAPLSAPAPEEAVAVPASYAPEAVPAAAPLENPRVGPRPRPEGVVVNVPQRMLYLWRDGELEGAWPVAVGRRGWRTPVGRFSIVTMEEDPTWDVPPSIQREMRRKGRKVVRRVPPGPSNPLGPYWIGLSVGNIGIHGTNAPESISRFATHGCVRMRSEHVSELFSRVEVGMPVEIVYEPVLVTVADDGVWLEAHPDPYRRVRRPEELARAQAEDLGVAERVDWEEAEQVLRRRKGVARRVGEALPEATSP